LLAWAHFEKPRETGPRAWLLVLSGASNSDDKETLVSETEGSMGEDINYLLSGIYPGIYPGDPQISDYSMFTMQSERPFPRCLLLKGALR